MPYQKVKKETKKQKTKEFQWGHFSPKSIDFIENSNAFINIAHGAVRSSKTITCDVRWLYFLGESPNDEFLMTGKTWKTLERNILRPIMEMLEGNIPYKYDRYEGTLTIEDKTCWLMGLNDEGVTDRIKGMTVGGWYADEITTSPKSAVEMAITRCSLPESKIFWTTNPDTPYHYIYTDYINNQKLLDAGDVKVWQFLLTDNYNLPSNYVEQLKRIHSKSQTHYKRNILGQWVIAEGAIYDHFSETQHVFTNTEKIKYDSVIMGCDYGVSTVCVFGAMGIQKNPKGNHYYLLEEWYYDAKETGISKSDSEYITEMLKLQNKYQIQECYLPHDAKSLKTAAEKTPEIHMNIHTYTPDTYGDIETIQNLIRNNQFHIHESCTNSIMQAQTYCWDAKAQTRGEDKPLKENDHCPDMWRGPILGPMKTPTAQVGVVYL